MTAIPFADDFDKVIERIQRDIASTKSRSTYRGFQVHPQFDVFLSLIAVVYNTEQR